jgi:hypothetical protein
MNVQQLTEILSGMNPRMEIEVATSTEKHPDEWYEVACVEVVPNWRDNIVLLFRVVE